MIMKLKEEARVQGAVEPVKKKKRNMRVDKGSNVEGKVTKKDGYRKLILY
jgi:hypothetical protein